MTDNSKKAPKKDEADLSMPAFELEGGSNEIPQDDSGIKLHLGDDDSSTNINSSGEVAVGRELSLGEDDGVGPSLLVDGAEQEPPVEKKSEAIDTSELSFTVKADNSHTSGSASAAMLLEKMRTGFSEPQESDEEEKLNKDDDLLADLASFNETRSGFALPSLGAASDEKAVAGSEPDLEFNLESDHDKGTGTGIKVESTSSEVKIEVAPLVPQKPEIHFEEPVQATAVVAKPIVEQVFEPAPEEEMDFSFSVADSEDSIEIPTGPAAVPVKKIETEVPAQIKEFQSPAPRSMSSTDIRQDMEIQSTLRQMREEREELLREIKEAKNNSRDLEQDNLTLKAALEESKIEISILRKRHLTELEDLKYRLSISEDKKILAEEKTKALLGQKEKLEQKVRIDLSQVRQREKELETKLEMLAIDVDAQVQSRDQKILELRRKIDSLEFNMENVSIKEQKTTDDKRKIEDKLNKIMKTLRNSIKNLEEDADSEVLSARDSTIGKNK